MSHQKNDGLERSVTKYAFVPLFVKDLFGYCGVVLFFSTGRFCIGSLSSLLFFFSFFLFSILCFLVYLLYTMTFKNDGTNTTCPKIIAGQIHICPFFMVSSPLKNPKHSSQCFVLEKETNSHLSRFRHFPYTEA